MIDREPDYNKLWAHLVEHARCDARQEHQPVSETTQELEEVGRYWRELRYTLGLSREAVLKRMGDDAIERTDLSLFENGLKSAMDLPPRFLPRLSEVLGGKQHIKDFVERFGSKLFPNFPDLEGTA